MPDRDVVGPWRRWFGRGRFGAGGAGGGRGGGARWCERDRWLRRQSGIDLDAGFTPDEQPFEADPPRPDAPPNPVNVRACNALRQGVAAPVAVTGQEVFTIEAPAIASDDRVYRVAIPPRAGAASHVTFTAPAAGEYVLFTSATVAVPLTVFALDGELIDIRLRLRIPECPEVNGRHSVQLRGRQIRRPRRARAPAQRRPGGDARDRALKRPRRDALHPSPAWVGLTVAIRRIDPRVVGVAGWGISKRCPQPAEESP